MVDWIEEVCYACWEDHVWWHNAQQMKATIYNNKFKYLEATKDFMSNSLAFRELSSYQQIYVAYLSRDLCAITNGFGSHNALAIRNLGRRVHSKLNLK